MLMWLTDGRSNLVMDNQCFLEALVCQEDVGRHPCCSGEGDDEWSDQLVEAFVNIDAGSCDFATSSLLELEVKLGKVPALFGTSPWHTSEHSWVSPGTDPMFEVLYPDRSPQPVDS